ncbi:hypothetical protein FACS189473_1910 [Spirochaetia bacterium]|nr:hypothetical protein FACS189473_1910 [Spirochaetia bacterium]
MIVFLAGFIFAHFSFAQEYLDKPALKLDLPLFGLPYQIDAAKTLEYGFFESYTHPGMDASLNITNDMFSAFHFGMKKFKDIVGLDTPWKRYIYYTGTAAGDSLFFFLPPGYAWMHESFHRAVLTHSGVRSHIEYNLPQGAVTVPDSGSFLEVKNYIRTTAAGMEGEVLLVEKMQRNNFFYEQNMFHEFAYWFLLLSDLAMRILHFCLRI